MLDSPLFVLFGVAALGYLVGKIGAGGFSLGVAAVLFVGLFVGALAPVADLPEFVAQLGLVIFVYTLGLSSAHGFFAALRLRGLRDTALALGVIGVSFMVTAALSRFLGLRASHTAGLFAGALTNTPALVSAVDALKSLGAGTDELAAPVVAYSICYPLGVLMPLVAIWLAERMFRAKSREEGPRRSESSGLKHSDSGGLRASPIINATVLVEATQRLTARQLKKTADWSVNFGRLRRAGQTTIVHDETHFQPGDLVTVIGKEACVAAAARAIGTISELQIDNDRSEIDYRRMFVSNAEVVERPIGELQLTERHEAVITRVRRGDVDLVPDDDFELELGDRARVLAPRARMPEVAKLLGDSLRHASEVDVIAFSLGIALGLLLGAIPLPAPGGTFRLGIAGGPLIAGLLLGRIGRTGPLVWTSPFGANLTLRQFGLVLFLAAVGLRAGKSLAGTFHSAEILPLFLAGALITLVAASLSLYVGHKLLKIPLTIMIGALGGIQTQPAVLAFAVQKAGNDLPNLGYAGVYPISMIAKVIMAQAFIYMAR
jgi:putative transport protein